MEDVVMQAKLVKAIKYRGMSNQPIILLPGTLVEVESNSPHHQLSLCTYQGDHFDIYPEEYAIVSPTPLSLG